MKDEPRTFHRADIEFTLRRPGGWRARENREKHWFFEIPASRDTEEDWTELLHRLFYDVNVVLRQREPGDTAWLSMEAFETHTFDPGDTLLNWDGKRALPWFVSERNKVWEPTVCYYVGEDGAYDTLLAADFTELMMHRLLAAGRVDKEGFLDFFSKFFPKAEPDDLDEFWENRETRLGNIAIVRKNQGRYKKPPGHPDVRSGPLSPDVIPGM